MVFKIINSTVIIDSFSKKKMNFKMTATTKFTKIFYMKIFLIFVNMMDIKSFGFTFANFAEIFQISFSNYNITPRFISGPIQRMFFYTDRVLTFFRTKTRCLMPIRGRSILFKANNAVLNYFWLFNANLRAEFRSFNSVITWIKVFSTRLANFNNFGSGCHIERLYAN